MPRYFFKVEGLPGPDDVVGTVLDGREQARSMAVFHAGEIMRDSERQFWTAPEWRLQVTDEQGGAVCTLSIKGTTDEA